MATIDSGRSAQSRSDTDISTGNARSRDTGPSSTLFRKMMVSGTTNVPHSTKKGRWHAPEICVPRQPSEQGQKKKKYEEREGIRQRGQQRRSKEEGYWTATNIQLRRSHSYQVLTQAGSRQCSVQAQSIAVEQMSRGMLSLGHCCELSWHHHL
jgi:hypothetical protein